MKFGHRLVGIVGTFLMAVGWIGLAYSNSLATMIAFHSIPGGMTRMYFFINRKIEVLQFFTLLFGLVCSKSNTNTSVKHMISYFIISLHVKKKIQTDLRVNLLL